MTFLPILKSSVTLQVPSSPDPSSLDQDAQSRDDLSVIPETPLATPSDEYIALRAQREEARRLRADAEMATMRREMEADLTIARAGTPTALITTPRMPATFPSVDDQRASGAEEGTHRDFLLIRIEYPMINENYLRQIAENKFDPINFSKLCTDVAPTKKTVRTIDIAKEVQINAGEKDSILAELKGLQHLLRCLIVYFQIRLNLAPQSIYKKTQQSIRRLSRSATMAKHLAHVGISTHLPSGLSQVEDLSRHR